MTITMYQFYIWIAITAGLCFAVIRAKVICEDAIDELEIERESRAIIQDTLRSIMGDKQIGSKALEIYSEKLTESLT